MMKNVPLAAVLCVLLAGCASDAALKEGQRLIAAGKPQEGLAQLEAGMKAHPDDLHYRTAYLRQKQAFIDAQLMRADAALQAGQLDAAQAGYREVLLQHPEDARAVAGVRAVEAARRNLVLLGEAEKALKQGDLDAARRKLRAILEQEPGQAQAQALLAKVEEKAGQGRGLELPQLGSNYRRPVTLEFRDAPLKSVFDALARQSGLNFMFDKDVHLDQRTTLFARGTTIVDALDMLLASNQLARKALNDNSLLIYPNQPAKQRDYQDMVVRAFFLGNADAKQIMALIKTVVKTKDVYVDEKLNMVVMRDTPDAVRLAEKLVRLSDRPEPEVVLDVEVMEVSRSKLLDLGVQWPNQLSVLNNVTTTTPTLIPNAAGTQTLTSVSTTTASTLPMSLQQILLNNLKNPANIAINASPQLNVNATDSDVNLLANPRIRVVNKGKASIHIGDKVPVITSNVTSTGVTSESVSYLDVGLKLDVEPQVYLQGDVGIKVGLEVSNIAQQVKTATGTLTYQLGSRQANTALRLKDGETQVLAGLISDEDRASANKVPGLGDIPLLGHLFSSNSSNKTKTEIVLLITPHIVRNIELPDLADAEFFAGTDATISGQPMRLRPTLDLPAPVVDAPEPEPGMPPLLQPEVQAPPPEVPVVPRP